MPRESRQDDAAERPGRKARLAVITVLIAVVLALLVAEITMRMLFPHHSPETVRRHSMPYIATAYGGYLIEPVDRLIDLDQDKAWGIKAPEEPSAHSVYISANGYRGPAFDVRKPAGVYRIIVLGGSAVFDQRAVDSTEHREGSWPHQMGALLRDRGYANVEVINAGVPGQNSADSLGRLYAQLWIYEPDMLVVYHGWNDIKFWHRLAVTPETPLTGRVRPFRSKENPFMYYRGPLDRFFSHSQIYIRIRNQYFKMRVQPGVEGAMPVDPELSDSYGEHGPRQFRLNMELIVSASRAIGATPVLVTQASLLAAHNDDQDRERIGYRYQGLQHDAVLRALEQTYRIVRDIGQTTDTLVVDIAKQMNGRSELFIDHVHTSPAGSRLLARTIALAIAPKISSPDAATLNDTPGGRLLKLIPR